MNRSQTVDKTCSSGSPSEASCEFAGKMELVDKETHKWQWASDKDPELSVGRICKLDLLYCANWNKAKLVARCPTRRRAGK